MDLVGQWRVLGWQFDLLDNRPIVKLVRAGTSKVIHLSPAALRELYGMEEHLFQAGWLQGYSDRHFGDVSVGQVAVYVQSMTAANDNKAPELVPGG
ncbi:MAG: hypothetical protein ACRBBW_03735 [Cellvibrionaceae bacterium]